MPGAFVSLSHEVSPVWREYERASTTIADAFVKPIVTGYVERVGDVIRRAGGASRWNMLASNGGYLLADEAVQRPAQLLLSGLAGGVIGARHFAGVAGHPSAFSLDMGGTSSDIGLVLDGDQRYASEFQLAWGVPVTIPCVSVTTIGAGGGSIAWVDKGGLLHVGPQSAGAQPGPVAYGMGGTEATVTDANLTLGRLDAAYFLGGEVEIDGDAAVEALRGLGETLGLTTEQAALAVVETTDENMANAIRLIAVEQGLDPRELALIAFGGAGPLHARAVAERLGIETVLVPPHPGLCSAFGAAITEARVDRVQTTFLRSETIDVPRLAAVHRRLVDETVAELRRSVDVDAPVVVCTVAMRYAGQNYELEVPVPEATIDEAAWTALVERFAAQHAQQYGFSLDDEPVELVNLRVTALRREPPTASAAHAATEAGSGRTRPVWFDASAPIECSVVRRESLAPGASVRGPGDHRGDRLHDRRLPGRRGRGRAARHARADRGSGTMSAQRLELDTVGLHVLHNALTNIASEMAIVMMKTSYSTIFNEGLDFSTVLLDRNGTLIAEKNFTPSMMGAVNHAVQWTLEELGEEFFEPGDVVVHNDPYRGNCHIPEHMLMKPIFQEGELIGFSGAIGHLAEVGGKAPGSFASDATDVYQEGLRLPPVKLLERGRYNEQLWRVILANHRTPRNTWGDFHAMIGALNIGERRLLELVERRGRDTVVEGAQRLIAYSERRLRAEIAELPAGRYCASMTVEDDGVSSDPFDVQVAITIADGEVIADFTGSSPQVRGPMNCTYVVVAAALYNAVFCVDRSGGADPAQLRLLSARAGRSRPRARSSTSHTPAPRSGATRICSRSSSTSCCRRSPRPCPSGSRPRAAARAATCCSAACTRRPAATTRTTTSTAWAPAARSGRTATTAR